MTGFRPTVPAAGRLVRLGIVLDPRNRPDRLREIARMCDGAGIESLWVRDAPPGLDPSTLESWTAITLAANEAAHSAVGAVIGLGLRPPETLASMAATLDAATGGRVELTFSARVGRSPAMLPSGDVASEVAAEELRRYVGTVRGLLERLAVGASEMDQAEPEPVSPDVGIPRLSVEAVHDGEVAVAVRVADDVLIPASTGSDVRPMVDRIRRACEGIGRDPATIGVALEAPVSIGRTTAEALARAESEPLFHLIGQPGEVGVFGTLEQCQERVIDLAHAGVTDLRCVVPNSPDIHDVIAQLTATVVGSVDVLTPGAPRSKAPDPPSSWGGRSVSS